MPDANLFITHDHPHAEAARANASGVLEDLGASAVFLPGGPPGVFFVQVSGEPRHLVRAALDLCRRDPSRFAHTHHWRPVDLWTRAEQEAMAAAARELGRRIGPRDTWKLTADVHGPSRWHTHDLVKPLTDPIRAGQVVLEKPAKELRVDLLGDRAAFALLERGDELSVDQVKRAGLEAPQEV